MFAEPLNRWKSNPRGILNVRGVFAWLEKEQLGDQGQAMRQYIVCGSYALIHTSAFLLTDYC